jgi:hypothetical protein
MSLLNLEPALGNTLVFSKTCSQNWTMNQHYTACRNLSGHRHGQLYITRPSKKRGEDLLKLSRHQQRTVVAFLMGHTPVKKHLNIMSLFVGNPDCRLPRCRLKHHSTLFAVARPWLASIKISLGSSLYNLKIQAWPH